MARIRKRLTFANVCSFLALVVALTTGGAYAANTILSSDIVDGQVKTEDLGTQAVTGEKVAADSLTTADLAGIDDLVTINLPNGLAKGCREDPVTINGVKPGDILITQVLNGSPGINVAYRKLTEPGKVTLTLCNLTGSALSVDKLRVHVFTLARRHQGPHERG